MMEVELQCLRRGVGVLQGDRRKVCLLHRKDVEGHLEGSTLRLWSGPVRNSLSPDPQNPCGGLPAPPLYFS